MSINEERRAVAVAIRSFLDGTGDEWEFDDLINQNFRDDLARDAVNALMDIQNKYPSDVPNKFCSEVGLQKISEIVKQLRFTLGTPGEV